MALAFDTLGYAQRLRAAGVDQSIAEAHAEAARDFIMAELVTKSDLKAALDTVVIKFGLISVTVAGLLFAALRLT